MLMSSLEIKNYRSLEHVKLDGLQEFNVLIGRNNAGKSSVFQALYDLNSIYYNNAISTDILTNRDNTRSFEIIFTFKFNQRERAEFVQILIDAGFNAQHRNAILESSFLQEIQFTFKSAVGNPSLMYLLETRIVAQDGEWVIIQTMYSEEGIANPPLAHVLISTMSKIANQDPLDENILSIEKTEHVHRPNVSYNRIFVESWTPDLAVRWLYTKLGNYLSKAFFFNPFRHRTTPVMDVSQTTKLDQDGSNLAQVLHTLRAGEEETFEAIERFIQDALPDIGTLRTPLRDNNRTNIVFRQPGKSFSIPLTDMGGGIEQLLMIATVLMMPATQNSTLFWKSLKIIFMLVLNAI